MNPRPATTPPRPLPRPEHDAGALIRILPGRPGDYAALARFHYRPARPATIVHTLAAADAHSGEVVGVLTISMPTLNGPWRAVAWPALFGPRSGRALARSVNRHLRTISRVIVDPRYRALGVARRLVQAYLEDPLTPCTEALASMGRFCPFFARAGMRELLLTAPPRDGRLRAALAAAGIEPWQLIDLTSAARLLRARDTLRRDLLSWANDSRATRWLRPAGEDAAALAPLAALAGAALTARPLAYASA
jgi:hypothetical protein